ncbi:MAG: alpha/beta fold hydrolase, partial [Alphaproteobacteria bacterium]
MPLFPATDAFATHMLPVGQGHTLYIEQSGNPSGIPVIVLHGGPGSGFSPTTSRRFNPAVYHIVCFDQRGAGKSTPSGSFDANITPYLVQDIAAVLTHLGIAQAVLYGTSWGSTLALAFAQANPEKVLGMVLGGIFLGTQEELEWVNLPTGMARLRWPQYQQLLSVFPGGKIPENGLENGLLDIIQGGDDATAKQAARAYATYECSGFFPEPDMEAIRTFVDADEHIVAHISIELYYFANRCFLQYNQLLKGCAAIAHIPAIIVQGGL